ncbi:hypothetical protein C8Q74DRAFT_587396 [Fomes fomentarius]|nr:hypothetical protein C8Q74DRAFT_587396 [Fomes fomentarius]
MRVSEQTNNPAFSTAPVMPTVPPLAHAAERRQTQRSTLASWAGCIAPSRPLTVRPSAYRDLGDSRGKAKDEKTQQANGGRYSLVELRHKVVGAERLVEHAQRGRRARVQRGVGRGQLTLHRLHLLVLLSARVAPVDWASLRVHRTVGHVYLVIHCAVWVLAQVVRSLLHRGGEGREGCVAALARDRLLGRGRGAGARESLAIAVVVAVVVANALVRRGELEGLLDVRVVGMMWVMVRDETVPRRTYGRDGRDVRARVCRGVGRGVDRGEIGGEVTEREERLRESAVLSPGLSVSGSCMEF